MLFITLTMKTKQIFLYNITIYVLCIIILYNIIIVLVLIISIFTSR